MRKFNKINQTGSIMIEAMAMLALIALVTPTLYKKSAERTLELQDINSAANARTLMKAVDSYVSVNYNSLKDTLTDSEKPVEIDLQNIKNWLPYGYNVTEQIKSFDAPQVFVQKQGNDEDMSITSFIVFKNKGELNAMRASRIASMIGANGGYVDKDGKANGVGGVWSLNDTKDFCGGSNCTKSSVIVASSESINDASRAAAENSKYLQRVRESESENDDWRNTMATDLYMGGTTTLTGSTEAMHGIYGVNQMIIGGGKGSSEAKLAVTGDAVISGALTAMGENFSVSNNADSVPELKFANALEATDSLVRVKTEFETTGETAVATTGEKFRVGDSETPLLYIDTADANLYDGLFVLSNSSSTLDVGTETVNISGKTTVGQGTATPETANLNPQLNVQGNEYVSGTLEANKIATHEFDTLTLQAGANAYTDAHRRLNVTANDVKIKDTNGTERFVAQDSGVSIKGSDGQERFGITDTATTISSSQGYRMIQVNKRGTYDSVNMYFGEEDDGGEDVVSFNKNALSVYDPGYNNRLYIGFDNGNTELVGPGNYNNDTGQLVITTDETNLKGVARVNIETIGDSDNNRVSINTDNFRVMSDLFEVDGVTKDIDDLSNPNNGSNASIYIRRGAIEVEGAPRTNGNYAADQGIGYIEASRFVANNKIGDDVVRPEYPAEAGATPYDRYMINPAYTSVMHDIKLTTRGGARLSDILPDFINKGIYVVTNTYAEGVDFNDLGPGGNSQGNFNPDEATQGQWASPYLGLVPGPLCPPGYAKVITITPATFQMAQVGGANTVSHYVDESENIRNYFDHGHKISTGQEKTVKDGSNNNQTVYYLGSETNGTLLTPLYIQQSTWLKSKVVPYSSNGEACSGANCSDFAGWAAVMGFIYPSSLYGTVVDRISRGSSDTSHDIAVYWNIFPVLPNTLEAYATIYCYFDRTNIFGNNFDSGYVTDEPYLVDSQPVSGSVKHKNEGYVNRLDDPHLKYRDQW